MSSDDDNNKVQAEQIAGIRRDTARIETAVQLGFAKIESEIKLLHDTFVLKEVYRSDQERLSKALENKADKEQFEDVKGDQRKVFMSIITGVIAAGLAALYAFTK